MDEETIREKFAKAKSLILQIMECINEATDKQGLEVLAKDLAVTLSAIQQIIRDLASLKPREQVIAEEIAYYESEIQIQNKLFEKIKVLE